MSVADESRGENCRLTGKKYRYLRTNVTRKFYVTLAVLILDWASLVFHVQYSQQTTSPVNDQQWRQAGKPFRQRRGYDPQQ